MNNCTDEGESSTALEESSIALQKNDESDCARNCGKRVTDINHEVSGSESISDENLNDMTMEENSCFNQNDPGESGFQEITTEETDCGGNASLSDLVENQIRLGSIDEIPSFLESMTNSLDIDRKKTHLAALIATEDHSILEKFVSSGGWAKLFEWLEESKKLEDLSYLARLLDLYKLLPVTVQMLKENTCAKSIKQLIKSQNEVIGYYAKVIIDDWMLKVTHNKQKDHNSSKSKKLKHLGKQKSDESEKSNDGHNISPTLDKPASRKRSNSSSSDSFILDSSTASEVKITVKVLPPRPKFGLESTTSGFMNALSSSHLTSDRKKRKISPKKPSAFSVNKNSNDGQHGDGGCLAVEDDDEKTDVEDNISYQMHPLLEPNEKKRKKTVTWASDGSLCSYHYFPMDETERVNVNHVGDFNEIRRHEIEMEHRMFQNSRKGLHCHSLVNQWRRPAFLTGISYLVEPGCNSTEKKTQMMREQNVLQVLYFSKRLVPDHPTEPDPEIFEIAEPKLIPLSDITGTNSEVLYEHTGNMTSSLLPSSLAPLSIPSSTSSTNQTSTIKADVRPSSLSSLSTTTATTTITTATETTNAQIRPTMATAMPWVSIYGVPPPVMPPMIDPQGIPNMMPTLLPPIYTPGFIPPPGFVHPPPPLLPPDFLRGCRPLMPHMPMPMPMFPGAALLCTHFLAGNCKFGSNCRFFHPPSPAAPGPTINQPSTTKT